MIYLDHAAATPVCRQALEAMRPYFDVDFFNPSAAYLPAREVALAYENAKSTIAHAIGAKSSDLVVTAGATEANNLAFGVVKTAFSGSKGLEFSERHTLASRENRPTGEPLGGVRNIRPENSNLDYAQDPKKTVLTNPVLYLATEHDSVRRPAERAGGAPVKVLPSGVIDLADLRAKITDATELISVALVNNEIGVIQPLAEIAALIREIKLDRWKRGVKTQLLLHSDASQALNLLEVNVARLGVDLLTLNAAKVYGPKGVGALYVSHEARLHPLSVGGGQENGLRSGTENVPGVVGFATAIAQAKEHLNGNRKKYASLKQILLDELEDCEIIPISEAKKRKRNPHQLDNFVNVCYNGIDGERLVYLLEERSILVATGAACAASKGEKSHVLKSIGLSDAQIAGSLRLTLGETNDENQIHEAARVINAVVKAEWERMHG